MFATRRYTDDLRRVETNMRSRRARLLAALHEDEIAPTVVAFPLLGVGDSAGPGLENKGPVAASSLVPDAVINPHPRFGTLTRNIRSRRGATVDIRAPRFLDANTPPDAGDIAADAMAFGMGCCCLQVTFQCRDVEESRHVYDQLAVLAPVMMALTAAYGGRAALLRVFEGYSDGRSRGATYFEGSWGGRSRPRRGGAA